MLHAVARTRSHRVTVSPRVALCAVGVTLPVLGHDGERTVFRFSELFAAPEVVEEKPALPVGRRRRLEPSPPPGAHCFGLRVLGFRV
jgi:hypothetical protein